MKPPSPYPRSEFIVAGGSTGRDLLDAHVSKKIFQLSLKIQKPQRYAEVYTEETEEDFVFSFTSVLYFSVFLCGF